MNPPKAKGKSKESKEGEKPKDTSKEHKDHSKDQPVKKGKKEPQPTPMKIDTMNKILEDRDDNKSHASGTSPMRLDHASFGGNEKVCIHHGQTLMFFCETCEEPICNQCAILGPHNNQLHRRTAVIDIYKSRAMKLSHSINTGLLPKKDQLLAQIHRLEYRIEEIKYVKGIIERDIRAEFSAMLEKLNRAEGTKTTLLQHEIAEIQKDLEKINEIGEDFMELTGEKSDLINFLLQSRRMYENIEFLLTKPLKTNIDIYPYDLPREMSEIKTELEKIESYKMALKFKDEVIFRLLLERKANEERFRGEADKEISEEVSEWAKLTDKYANELKNYQLVCFYCGVMLDPINVNKKCKANLEQIPADCFCDKAPNERYHKTGKHFFSQPRQDAKLEINEKFKELKNLPTEIQKPVTLSQIVAKIKKVLNEQNLDLMKILDFHDKLKTGAITMIQFSYILSEYLKLSNEEMEKIVKEMEVGNSEKIKSHDFLNLIFGKSGKVL